MQRQTIVIACPNCSSAVALEVMQLIAGTKFRCFQCSALIGLSTDSTALVKEAVERYQSTQKTENK